MKTWNWQTSRKMALPVAVTFCAALFHEYLASAQFRESVQPRVLIPVDMCMLPWEYNICMAHDGAVMDMLVDALRPG
jgi:hypothetical protein